VQEAYQDASRVANDAISSIRTVSSFCAEEKVAKLYEEKCQKPLNSGIRQGYISGTGLAFSNFVLFSCYGLAFWFGSKLVAENKTSFSKVFKVSR
jgi:ATP-binding cassette subfamily B (MDR/TAP) protein 1